MTNTEQPTAITMYASRMMTLATIKALPIDRLNERQPMLVDLLVSIVNYETDNGSCTDGNVYVSSQDYWKTLLAAAKDCGFEFLGNGFFSAAFKHEMLPQKVIKIGFKKEDSGAANAEGHDVYNWPPLGSRLKVNVCTNVRQYARLDWLRLI